MNNSFSIGIVGSGTSGLVSALMLKQAFPSMQITILSSPLVPIVGVGEGSTEHWKWFMSQCEIPLHGLLTETAATHKYGIRFENWSVKNPDYFHSVSGDESLFAWNHFPMYAGFIEKNKMLTTAVITSGLTENKIRRTGLHENTNQYHFDTFKLNDFFKKLCFQRMIRIIEADIKDIEIDNESGNITSVTLPDDSTFEADFWIDATGFKRLLMQKIGSDKWNSFSKFLLTDSAVAFQTESDPNGEIRPYTRARAASSGWIWEIPTQERRGNGYVFSSQFISKDQAVDELHQVSGYQPESFRDFKYDAGYLEKPWVKNCCAIGLSSAFVEPLEATSIGTTIQQMKLLISNLCSYTENSHYMQNFYNKKVSLMMDNVLTMIRLHYISDRKDTPFWRAMSEMPLNESLQELVDLWSERLPIREDVNSVNNELFHPAHFIHVAQGQNILNRNSATIMIERFNLRSQVVGLTSSATLGRFNHELVDHAQSLKDLYG